MPDLKPSGAATVAPKHKQKMCNEGKRTGWQGAGIEGEKEANRVGMLSFLSDRDLKLHSRAHGPRHQAEISACVLVFTSQLTYEGKSLTSVGAAGSIHL